ncbi:MAG: WecB/TagA/CpsF family glycosyltransferase [Actinomycetes bacterium]
MTSDGPAGQHPHYPVLGTRVAALSTSHAATEILSAAREGRPLQVHLCNSYTLSLAAHDPRLRTSLDEADLNLPDGAPVAWLGRRHGLRGPVRGLDLFRQTVDAGRASGTGHYLYGGAPGVAERMRARLERDYPGVRVTGCESPPYRSLVGDDFDALARTVRSTCTDVLWIGIGTPKQDYAVSELAKRTDVPVVPIGAAFDFYSGVAREAPRWLRGTGFEWAFRLASEPRRLWRRYLVETPLFAFQALTDRTTTSPQPARTAGPEDAGRSGVMPPGDEDPHEAPR